MPPDCGKPIPEPSQTCTQRPVTLLRTNCEVSNRSIVSAMNLHFATLSFSKTAMVSCFKDSNSPEMKNSLMSILYTVMSSFKLISPRNCPTWFGFVMRYGMQASFPASCFCNHNPNPLKLYLPEQCKFLTETWGLWLFTVKFNWDIKLAPGSFGDFASWAPNSGLSSKSWIFLTRLKYLA